MPNLNDLSAAPYGGGVGRVTPTGSVQEYQIDQLVGCPGSIVAGRDGRVWLADDSFTSNLVYAVSVTGAFTVTSYPLDQGTCGCAVHFVNGITTGTSGAVTVDGSVDTSTCAACPALVVVAAGGTGSVQTLTGIAPNAWMLQTVGGAIWAAARTLHPHHPARGMDGYATRAEHRLPLRRRRGVGDGLQLQQRAQPVRRCHAR